MRLKQDFEPYKAQEDINLLLTILPTLGENLRMAQLCKGVGLTIEAIKKLFRGETLSVTGKLHSTEHGRYFDVQDAKMQILKEQGKPTNPTSTAYPSTGRISSIGSGSNINE